MDAKLKHMWTQWGVDRQKCRTDLWFLVNEVLGYDLPSREVNGPFVDNLQRFKGGEDFVDWKGDGRFVGYKPFISLWELEGNRQKLLLDPRGFFKTTLNTISHSIQWIINFPDIRILISTATQTQAQAMLTELKAHFQYNGKFRYLFPEFCPLARKATDWGSREEFTVMNRQRKAMKEATVSTCSVGKVVSGFHYEIIKHSDLVETQNTRTTGQIQQVKDHFALMDPLLERSPLGDGRKGWVTLEGTRYDFSDLYGMIEENEEKKTKEERTWQVFVRSGVKDDGTAWDPKRWPVEEYERLAADPTVGPWVVSCQYYNRPLPDKGGLAQKDQVVFMPQKIIRRLGLAHHVTIDLAGMEKGKEGTDYSVITLGGYDRDGRLYIPEIHHDRFSVFEVIEVIFDLHDRYPNIITWKMEKDAHARVLLPFIEREMVKRKKYLPIEALPRDTTQSKQDKLRALQPWFATKNIRFSDAIPLATRIHLLNEITRFPKYNHDDILDTLRDQMENRDGGVESDILPRDPEAKHPQHLGQPGRFTGFNPWTHDPQWTDEPDRNIYDYY